MPAPTKVQLTGGQFQDSEGNKLALGYLIMKLAMDANISGVGNIASGIEIKILLDANGSVVSSPAQSVWGIDQMLPVNNYYRVTGYTAAGQPAWGPNNQQVVGNGGTFDVGTWVPNQVISWVPPLQALELDVNATKAPNQSRLNFEDSGSVTWAIDSNGNLEATAVIPAGVELQTNSVDNSDQGKLNLEDTATVTWASTAGGVVKATAVIPPQTPPGSIASAIPSWTSPTGFWFDSYTGYFAVTSGGIGSTAPSSVVAPTASKNGYVQLLNGSGSGAGLLVVYYATAAKTYAPWCKSAKIQVFTFQNTSCRYWIGLCDDTGPQGGGMSFANPTKNILGFRFDTGAGDTSWTAYASTDNVNFTTQATGVAVDTTGLQTTFEIRVTKGTPTEAKFYINGTLVATINSNVPASTTGLGALALAGSLGSFTPQIGANLFSVEQYVD